MLIQIRARCHRPYRTKGQIYKIALVLSFRQCLSFNLRVSIFRRCSRGVTLRPIIIVSAFISSIESRVHYENKFSVGEKFGVPCVEILNAEYISLISRFDESLQGCLDGSVRWSNVALLQEMTLLRSTNIYFYMYILNALICHESFVMYGFNFAFESHAIQGKTIKFLLS